MKVKDLIVELQKQNPEADVITEGCDCLGNVDRVEVGEEGDVMIGRSN